MESAVAQIVVRDIEDELKERLQRRAAEHGRSMEAEVRDILRDAVNRGRKPKSGLGSDIARLFAGIGLKPDEEIRELRGFRLKDPFEQ